jgi:glycosyltransferase involved in cell wall biosynthesis
MPKVSVLIPIYNVEKYLDKCLASVVNQTLKDIEILCLDDGSTDSSSKIIEKFRKQDSRIRVIRHVNQGYGPTMNIGLEQAMGDYIGIVESDDWVEAGMFETLHDLAVRYDLEEVKSNYEVFGWEGKIDYRVLTTPSKYHKVIDLSEDFFSLAGSTAHWCGIYKRSWLNKHQIRFNSTSGATYQDTSFFFLTTILPKKAYFLDQTFYHYRTDNPQSSQKFSPNPFAINKEYDYLRNYLMDRYELWAKYSKYYNYRKYLSYVWMLPRIDPAGIHSFLKRMSQEFKWAKLNSELEPLYFNAYQLSTIEELVENADVYFLTNFPSDDLEVLKQQFLEAHQEAVTAKLRVEEMENSTTWKVGRIVTAVPRRLKRIIS